MAVRKAAAGAMSRWRRAEAGPLDLDALEKDLRVREMHPSQTTRAERLLMRAFDEIRGLRGRKMTTGWLVKYESRGEDGWADRTDWWGPELEGSARREAGAIRALDNTRRVRVVRLFRRRTGGR